LNLAPGVLGYITLILIMVDLLALPSGWWGPVIVHHKAHRGKPGKPGPAAGSDLDCLGSESTHLPTWLVTPRCGAMEARSGPTEENPR
jgi:hypothetical protein